MLFRSQYRGSFEENIQNLVSEVKEAGNVILFFDEIHQILGKSSSACRYQFTVAEHDQGCYHPGSSCDQRCSAENRR